MRKIAIVGAVAVAAVGGLGCGSSQTPEDVAAAYARAGEAYGWARWDDYCDALSSRTQRLAKVWASRLALDDGSTCEAIVAELNDGAEARDFKLVGIAIDGDTATGRDPQTDSIVRFVRESGDWRIDDTDMGDDDVAAEKAEAEPDGAEAVEEESAAVNTCSEEGYAAGEVSGRCLRDGVPTVYQDRYKEAKLRTLGATLGPSSVESELSDGYSFETPRGGAFLVVDLAIRNRSDSPKRFAASYGQVALVVNARTYTPTSDGMFAVEPSWEMADEIQPGVSITGKLVFDVPERVAKRFERDGHLVVANFGDQADPDAELAALRGWQ